MIRFRYAITQGYTLRYCLQGFAQCRQFKERAADWALAFHSYVVRYGIPQECFDW
jgi:hypothetical protein